MLREVLGHPLQYERHARRIRNVVAGVRDADESRVFVIVGLRGETSELLLLRRHLGERRLALGRREAESRVRELSFDDGLVLGWPLGIAIAGLAERLERGDIAVKGLDEVDDDAADRVVVPRLQVRERAVRHGRKGVVDRLARLLQRGDRVGLRAHAPDGSGPRERTTRDTTIATVTVTGSARAICTSRGSSGSASYRTPESSPPAPKPSAYTS